MPDLWRGAECDRESVHAAMTHADEPLTVDPNGGRDQHVHRALSEARTSFQTAPWQSERKREHPLMTLPLFPRLGDWNLGGRRSGRPGGRVDEQEPFGRGGI
jgi:hypothetical protein